MALGLAFGGSSLEEQPVTTAAMASEAAAILTGVRGTRATISSRATPASRAGMALALPLR